MVNFDEAGDLSFMAPAVRLLIWSGLTAIVGAALVKIGGSGGGETRVTSKAGKFATRVLGSTIFIDCVWPRGNALDELIENPHPLITKVKKAKADLKKGVLIKLILRIEAKTIFSRAET